MISQCVKSVQDSVPLQENINNVHDWCHRNKLSVNINKCYVVRYSNKRRGFCCIYRRNNIALCRCESINDLGVFLVVDLPVPAN